MFKIEIMLVNEVWTDAEWTQDDEPLRFSSIEEGRKAIDEFVQDTVEAVQEGHMRDIANPDEYRVVPA